MSDTVGYILILGFIVLPLSAVMFKMLELLVILLQNQAILAAAPF